MKRRHNFWQPLKSHLRGACRKNLLRPDSQLHNFLRHNEWQHLHLSSLFVPQKHEAAKKQQLFLSPPKDQKAFIYSVQQDMEALLLWTKHGGLLFDRLSQRGMRSLRGGRESTTPESRAEYLPYLPLQELKLLLSRHTTRQFIGTHNNYEFLRSCYDFQFAAWREYWLMVRKPVLHPSLAGDATPRKSFSGMNLRRLDKSHLEQLLPLDLAYYAEEVLRGTVTNNLQLALAQQCVKRLAQYLQYGIFAAGELVARAMINAYGLYYWQIGGIYTMPSWRGQGLANALLQRLCHSIERAGRLPMLFVSVENQAALELYQKNSFERLERMVIAQDYIPTPTAGA